MGALIAYPNMEIWVKCVAWIFLQFHLYFAQRLYINALICMNILLVVYPRGTLQILLMRTELEAARSVVLLLGEHFFWRDQMCCCWFSLGVG